MGGSESNGGKIKASSRKPEPEAGSEHGYERAEKSLKYSILDGSANSFTEGFGKVYIVPFAIALKASTSMIGAISALPDLLGSLAQLASASIVERFRSRKKIIVLSALIQALLWLPLLFAPLIFSKYGPMLLLLFVSAQAICSYIINPLWNSWMGDLVPESERGRYFGKRNALTSAAVFISTFAAGYLLNAFSGISLFFGFGVLFILALISRLVSVYYLNKMHDVEYAVDKKAYFSFFDFVKRMSQNNYGRFVLYLCILNFVVYLAAPFFTVYMLRDLKFSYITFTLITLASLISSFVGMYFWGRYNDEHGSKSLLYINGLLVPIVPIFWLFTADVYWLFAIEIFSGFVWAGFNLGASNFIFDATTPQKRTRCIVYYNVLKGIFIFAGASIGGFLATHIKTELFAYPILALFLLSGILRMAASIIFLPLIKEMRLVDVPLGHSFFRTHVTIRPKEGLIYETIGTHRAEQTHRTERNNKQSKKFNNLVNKKDTTKKDGLKNRNSRKGSTEEGIAENPKPPKQREAQKKDVLKKSKPDNVDTADKSDDEKKKKSTKQLLEFLNGQMKK